MPSSWTQRGARFTRDGYAGTSVKDIAGDAGVSVQTVYDSVGSKADLVRGLNDLIDSEAQIFEIVSGLPTEVDPVAVARMPARITRRLVERCGDILRAGVAGAQAEPALASVTAEGGRRHRAGAAAIAARLSELGALRAGIDVGRAATSIATLADFRVALMLIDDHAMSFDAMEQWMTDTIVLAVM